MKISISGKGGSGKTTTAGILARTFARQGYPVLAIDGDNNPNLGIALGLAPDEVNEIPVLPRDLLQEVVDEEGNKSQVLSMELEQIAAEFGTPAPDSVRLLAMNRIDHAGKGWACRAHATVRSILAAQPTSTDTITVTDMEAGLEHLSRSTTRASDVMLVVAEPYYKSMETAARVKTMATELGIPNIYIVANKVRNPGDAEAIQAFCEKHDLELITTIPYDEKVAEASQIPQSPLDFYPNTAGVVAVTELATKLKSLLLN